MAALLSGANSPAQEPAFYPSEGVSCVDGPACGPGLCGRLAGMVTPPCGCFATFYVDYRIRRFGAAYTSYEFGDPDPAGASPLSQLKFPLNSTWNGFEVGLEDPRWAVRAEWLTPWSDDIDGQLEDRDWLLVGEEFTDLGVLQQRWKSAHMVDVALEVKLWEGQFGVPISVWPVGGFRWQKLDIMTFDGVQQKYYDIWWPLPPLSIEGDAIRFRQEYYQYYGGGQLRADLEFGGLLPNVRLTFQGDWADVQAFNFDHHLLREGIRFTKENSHGDAWHVGVTGEIFFTDQFTVGVEGEYTQIRTSGNHHFINEPLGIDETWTRGVRVWSNQTAVTLFLRLRF
jgi:hypothetical protein